MPDEKDPTEAPKTAEPHLHFSRQAKSIALNFDSMDEMAQWQASIMQPKRFDAATPFVLVPEGMHALNVEKHMERPARTRRNPVFLEAGDFIAYVQAFAASGFPQLFCTQDDKGFAALAVIDYDVPPMEATIQAEGQEPQTFQTKGEPRWGDHRPKLSLAWDLDYAAWRAASGKWFQQQEFALFIEENVHVLRDPTGADMLELAQEIKGVRSATFQAGQRLDNGARAIEYVEEIQARSTKGTLEVPANLLLEMPIYRGAPAVAISAAFSWRLKDDKHVEFSFRLMSKLQERDAQDAVRKRLSDELELPAFIMEDLGSCSARSA